jgi:hypothetical protein
MRTRRARRPVLHFVAIGAALFLLEHARRPATTAAPSPVIVITAAQVADLHDQFARRTGRPPTRADEAALVDDAVGHELLYREALARGLDRDDRSVQHRLVEKMRFLDGNADAEPAALYREALDLGLEREDPIIHRMLEEKLRLLLSTAPADAGDEDTLRAFYAAQPARYAAPARVTLTHVFLSAQARGGALRHDADAVLRALRTHAAAPPGDPFPAGARFVAASERELAKVFGAEFARAVTAIPTGTWSGPIVSAYGLHVVRVEDATPAGPSPFETVRRRVREDVESERRAALLSARLRDLRARYDVRVEPAADVVAETP